jgi:hypothetical protein
MINIEKVNIDDKDMYLITDTLTMQRICLTRDDLGTLHHKIDVQYMSEDKNYEESMQPLNQDEINNEIAYDDHKNKWST